MYITYIFFINQVRNLFTMLMERFGERDKTRETPVDITVAFAEIRKQAKWNQTVEVVVKVSTYDKNVSVNLCTSFCQWRRHL